MSKRSISEVSWPLIVRVEPMGAPRMNRSDRWRKRPCVIRYWQFRDAIRAVFGMVDLTGAIHVTVAAYLSMPESWSKKKKAEMSGQPHRQKCDCDNILKGVLDSLFEDDSGISSAIVGKAWADEKHGARLEITVK